MRTALVAAGLMALVALAGCDSGTGSSSRATAAALAHGHWATLDSSPSLETARASTSVAHGNKLFVWGRTSDGTGAIFNVGTDRWTTVPPAPISARADVAITWAGHDLFVWGGSTGQSATGFAANGAMYDPATQRWSTLPPAPLTARAGRRQSGPGTR